MPPSLTKTPVLRYWRVQRLLLQRELAQQAGVPLRTILRLERGRRAEVDSVCQLANAVRVGSEDQMRDRAKIPITAED